MKTCYSINLCNFVVSKIIQMNRFPIFPFNLFLVLLFVPIFYSCKGSDEPLATDNNSAYISQVFEYVYGPGQHAQLAVPTDTTFFIGKPSDNEGWLFLGGFGGYVVAGFNHNVVNGNGDDFEVFALRGSSPEPAVVYVMSDDNGDGKPNETWYELKGNQDSASIRNYWVRYYKAANDSANTTWKDSKGNRGELISGFGAKYSNGWWWPYYNASDSITLFGTRLPDSYENQSSNGAQYWVVPKDKFTWGYAENMYGTDFDTSVGANKLDISNAIDADGRSVNLVSIRFIKIQTGVFQQAGWTNEVSSEVKGAKDLRR